ncbi:MAG: hypothetical protein MK106_07075 [Mariniblastus sp.]|nr:hypothetical protein [Mariniblastus sp.]
MNRPIKTTFLIGILVFAVIPFTGCNAIKNLRSGAILKPSESLETATLLPNRITESVAQSQADATTLAKPPNRFHQLSEQGRGVAKKTGQILAAGFFYFAGWMIEDWLHDALRVQSETNRLWNQGFGYNDPNLPR